MLEKFTNEDSYDVIISGKAFNIIEKIKIQYLNYYCSSVRHISL